MTNPGPSTTSLFPKADKLMATIFPKRAAVPSHEDNDVPRAWESSHDSTFKTVVPSDRVAESGVKTETVWETMNPHTTSGRDSTSTTISTRLAKATATPATITKHENKYSTETSTSNESPDSLNSTLHHSGDDLSDGAIAAIVIGIIFALAVVALAIWLLTRKSHRRSRMTQITPPQTPIYSPAPPNSPLPTPPPLAELGNQSDRASALEDSWVSYGDRVRSPTPQPAVAEVRSFTRAWQKPRVYTVGGGRIAELQGSDAPPSPNDRDDDRSPISPMFRASSSQADRRVVSPVSLTSRFSKLSSRTDRSRERGDRRGL